MLSKPRIGSRKLLPRALSSRQKSGYRATAHFAAAGGPGEPTSVREYLQVIRTHGIPHDPATRCASGPSVQRWRRCARSSPSPAWDRFGQRGRVHQRPALALLPRARHPVHPRPPLQEGRQHPHRTETLDPRAQTARLGAATRLRRPATPSMVSTAMNSGS